MCTARILRSVCLLLMFTTVPSSLMAASPGSLTPAPRTERQKRALLQYYKAEIQRYNHEFCNGLADSAVRMVKGRDRGMTEDRLLWILHQTYHQISLPRLRQVTTNYFGAFIVELYHGTTTWTPDTARVYTLQQCYHTLLDATSSR